VQRNGFNEYKKFVILRRWGAGGLRNFTYGGTQMTQMEWMDADFCWYSSCLLYNKNAIFSFYNGKYPRVHFKLSQKWQKEAMKKT